MKKAIILYHSGGELANQLWNYISVYAYAKNTGRKIINNSFYEYADYFYLKPSNFLVKLLFFTPFKHDTSRKQSFKKRFFRFLYRIYVGWVRLVKRTSIVSTNKNHDPIYLPPSAASQENLTKLSDKKCVYFDGWLFRNPKGMEEYYQEIQNYFRPKEEISQTATKLVITLKSQSRLLIGVHIRQTDYAGFKSGKYIVSTERFLEIIKEYINRKNLKNSDVSLYIASDGKVDESVFIDFNHHISKENAVTDLFALSKTDMIIGSNSSFGNLASWYGNIPHIVVTKEPMDWNYYDDKRFYFKNKYCTLAKN